ncbi:hypothetical protein NKJ26_19400 [Mesorhizobium sp. M0152]|uniref:hypothetical protein n=1 Tax=Mesorhizobium sp. M0152 TaxID=2956898 RepID=UPI003334E414
MAKALTTGTPRHAPTSAAYEQDCKEMLAHHLDVLLDKVEATGWTVGRPPRP